MEPRWLVEPEQVRSSRRGAEGSQRPRRMESDLVVTRPEQQAEAALELDARDERR